MRTAVILASLAVVIAAAPVRAEGRLAGETLRETISGKQVYLATPLGGEFPLNYKANGEVDGSGKAVGLGKYMQPTDSGAWWVSGDRLCQKWKSWYGGREFCFTVEKDGPKTISWVRDDGMKGTARIEP
ncbi:MAG: hypothetical protein ABW275_07390 [Hansschlegelia sp.]